MDFLQGQILIVDKPLGWTSFDVVKRVRGMLTRRYGVKRFKVGHAGTLDPLATGLMLICTGRATKLIETLQAGTKEYIATIALGATTPSFDLEKPIDATYPTDHITPQMVTHILHQFTGTLLQTPPAFSAVKVDGRRAYKMARQGKDPDLKAKPIQIHELQLLSYSQTQLKLRILCSKGTYIRALARDIGIALHSGAHLTALRRTRVGQHSIYESMDVDSLLTHLKTIEIDPLPNE